VYVCLCLYRLFADGNGTALVQRSVVILLAVRGTPRRQFRRRYEGRRRVGGGDRFQFQPARGRAHLPGFRRPAAGRPRGTPSGELGQLGRPAAAGGPAAPTATLSEKRFDEGLAELAAHRAVEDEVDGVVEQRGDVQQVAERPVDVAEEVGNEDAAQRQHALRQLGQQKQADHRQQHRRRPVVLPSALRLVLSTLYRSENETNSYRI